MYNINIPKIELHVHLEGSVRISTLAELSGMPLEETQINAVAPLDCKNINNYLNKFELPLLVMQTKDNLTRISREFAEDLKNDEVIYAEVRITPFQHLKNGLTLDEVIDSVLAGLKQINIKTNLILCMMRNESYENNKRIIELAKRYLNKGIVAIDLVGDESLYKTIDFKDLFTLARSLEIPYTIHVGETGDWSSVLSAIDFGATRIGHGIRALENKYIINILKQKNILLEICPTSNVQTGIARSILVHPINELKKLGVNISINTDNRTVSFINLENEYKNLANSFKYGIKEFCKFNKMAINAAFISNQEKIELLMRVDEYLKQFS